MVDIDGLTDKLTQLSEAAEVSWIDAVELAVTEGNKLLKRYPGKDRVEIVRHLQHQVNLQLEWVEAIQEEAYETRARLAVVMHVETKVERLVHELMERIEKMTHFLSSLAKQYGCLVRVYQSIRYTNTITAAYRRMQRKVPQMKFDEIRGLLQTDPALAQQAYVETLEAMQAIRYGNNSDTWMRFESILERVIHDACETRCQAAWIRAKETQTYITMDKYMLGGLRPFKALVTFLLRMFTLLCLATKSYSDMPWKEGCSYQSRQSEILGQTPVVKQDASKSEKIRQLVASKKWLAVAVVLPSVVNSMLPQVQAVWEFYAVNSSEAILA